MTGAGSDVAAPMNLYNRAAERSLAAFDRTRVFAGQLERRFAMDAPGHVRANLGGWEISGISAFNSGCP